jgi:Cytochrome C oxidase, cbb3-type, subunit III
VIGRVRSVALDLSVVAVLAVLVMMIPVAAFAGDILITVAVPESATVGGRVEVKAVLTSVGEPVDGAVVSLTYRSTFAGKSGAIELDRETTGADGLVVLSYEQRASDNGEMRVEYLGPEDTDVAPAVFTIAVQPGGEQQERSEAGVSIWWLSGWLVIAVIMLVWGLIVFSAAQLVIVGRSATEEIQAESPVLAEVGSEEGSAWVSVVGSEEGSAWISVVLATVTLITAIGMVIVFVRNPLTHANLDEPTGYDRTPIVRIDEEFPYLGPGLEDPSLAESGDLVSDGQTLYFGLGCGGCHGIAGQGGVVGPELVGEVGSLGGFIEDVREGPRGMPGYAEEVLSDEQLAKIHAFLKQGDD